MSQQNPKNLICIDLKITGLDPIEDRIIEIATQRRLPLQIHGDPAVIDTVYDISPAQPVIWAHAGKYPYTDLIADYLQRSARHVASRTDVEQAYAVGVAAIELALEGKSAVEILSLCRKLTREIAPEILELI